jgi:hypothetical protein
MSLGRHIRRAADAVDTVPDAGRLAVALTLSLASRQPSRRLLVIAREENHGVEVQEEQTRIASAGQVGARIPPQLTIAAPS